MHALPLAPLKWLDFDFLILISQIRKYEKMIAIKFVIFLAMKNFSRFFEV